MGIAHEQQQRVFKVFVLISVDLCIPCSYFFIRVISAICVRKLIVKVKVRVSVEPS